MYKIKTDSIFKSSLCFLRIFFFTKSIANKIFALSPLNPFMIIDETGDVESGDTTLDVIFAYFNIYTFHTQRSIVPNSRLHS